MASTLPTAHAIAGRRAAVDVLVIGAGPAGCAAAIAARARGLEVVILETRSAPASGPGETLAPGIEPIFHTLGLDEAIRNAGFLRHRGVMVEWGGARTLQRYGSDARGEWLGFQADRRVLNTILQSKAQERGAVLMAGVAVDRVLREGDRVTGVLTAERAWRASWVLDAGGGRHWMARQDGAGLEEHSAPLHVSFGWKPAVEGTPLEPVLAATAGGWTWEARIDAARIAWCRLDFSSRAPVRKGTRDVTWRIARRTAGAGYFLLGDAACVVDPASSHGVLRAMMSGMKAAHGIAAVRDGFAEGAMLADYDEWMRKWFSDDVNVLRQLYRTHPTSPWAR